MTSRSCPRVVFLGLDGLAWSVARLLCDQGHLPHLSTLVHTPRCRAIAAELPELSPVNWTSLFTASGPGWHGVYGFTRLDPSSYQLSCTDFTHVHGQTLWERMAAQGLFAKVLNMPNAAPARPARAMIVGGFPAQSLSGAVYPPVLGTILEAAGYVVDADTVRGSTDLEFLLADLRRSLAGRMRAFDLMWPDLAWDFFAVVLTETDRLGHFLFPALVDPLHPWHTECLRFMQAWDRCVGHVLERYVDLPEPKRLLVMADHGFTSLEQEVDLNAWLRKHGLLRLACTPRHEWDAQAMDMGTRAFALDPGRIYFHTRERFQHGRLGVRDAKALERDLRQAVTQLTWQGRQVIRHCIPGRELYAGPQAHLAPDLVLVPEPGFDLKGKFDRRQIFGHFGRQGMHSADDVFFYDSAHSTPRTPADVGQVIAQACGISLPSTLV
ncbi:alkaline phosphatase family protein [Desulfovibrionales bacterium]